MSSDDSRQRLTVVIAGHVDHGKSTVIGRLLVETGSLPEGKLEQIRALCQRTGRPFEYAYLLDALKDERAQGITIDTARVFLNTPTREYLVLDAPGHVEFVRNLVTGASCAEAALLVIDAHEGVRDNSRRHGYLLGLLGVSQLAVVVNKMDLAGHDEQAFRRVAAEYTAFLAGIGLVPASVIPSSARDGDNIAVRSDRMPWYAGPTVLEALEGFRAAEAPSSAPFRMPVQDVYKFTGNGDDRRIVAGTIESGRLAVGDEVVFYPSGKRARVRSLEAFGGKSPREAAAGQAAGFTLDEQIYVTRGELVARAGEPRPEVTSRLRVGLFWLGRRPLVPGREYLLKLGSARVPMQVETIHRSLDAASLEVRSPAEAVERLEVAECTLALGRAIAVDPADRIPATARFVIVDQYDIAGGGLVREALADAQRPLRDRVLLRNYKWETSFIPAERRAARYRQQPTLLLLTGPRDVDRKRLAKALESRLFEEGQIVYFLGMANLLYGVDADLGRAAEDRAEHMRRLAEIANLLLDAGVLLVVTAAELTAADLDLIATGVPPGQILTVWLGDDPGADLPVDLRLSEGEAASSGVERLRGLLAARGAFLDAGGKALERMPPGVVWFTGLSGSGKSTVADWVAEELTRRGLRVERLDGDSVRRSLPGVGFTRKERDEHIRRIGHLASTLESNGIFVIASFVSPYAESRAFARAAARSFIEVYVATPLAVCEIRDTKGLYAKARRGELANFTGINDPYEPPRAPDVTIDTSRETVEEAGRKVLEALERRSAAS